jgi:hypothetical protein
MASQYPDSMLQTKLSARIGNEKQPRERERDTYLISNSHTCYLGGRKFRGREGITDDSSCLLPEMNWIFLYQLKKKC